MESKKWELIESSLDKSEISSPKEREEHDKLYKKQKKIEEVQVRAKKHFLAQLDQLSFELSKEWCKCGVQNFEDPMS